MHTSGVDSSVWCGGGALCTGFGQGDTNWYMVDERDPGCVSGDLVKLPCWGFFSLIVHLLGVAVWHDVEVLPVPAARV